jgi:hypothetical protein
VKLLIAAGEAVSDHSDVPVGVRSVVDAASEILVMSPSLTGRLHWLTGDNARARQVADERLEAVLGQLETEGVAASGVRGDELPRTAFADAIREFAPDHILIALRAAAHRGWQERGLLDHLVDHFRLPVTVFVIDA